ncbi:membrane protein insertion efficiency factor YidD [Nodularia sphaerocarpa]|uniref:membrane protein insertion efficiency factor YidD n=1 Tax=Nodularia sphaerocarpa TaxID=137816 RepID=UPI001EFBBF01|nr:membrane protein insertion efficiency factor YidD [Nodularia sphaerocarpa]MDB9375845.1 membrane protein insertion efficiency factor YidD [Nodularia sphaerocarpa CS-585]MDB9379341.1 membrane protein insertion efficiency factor YidD [Nodularia sphaerocarpa CS-585A2]ULP71837.1 Putative membrane protein insertion efficiency factor [Nodularia sphaerocarpa UHCC 0038]
MEISSFHSLTRQVGVAAITGYQKHISPHKGFACAHRVLYGDESCSQYFKRVIAEDGFSAALIQSRERFQACKQANRILHFQGEKPEKEPPNPQPPDKNPGGESIDCNDCVTGAECSANFAEMVNTNADCSAIDCSGADCANADCSGVDCSGADCSFLDCGSCG